MPSHVLQGSVSSFLSARGLFFAFAFADEDAAAALVEVEATGALDLAFAFAFGGGLFVKSMMSDILETKIQVKLMRES